MPVSTAPQTDVKPKSSPLQRLREQLAAVERTVDESRRSSAYRRGANAKRMEPRARREMQAVLQLVDSIHAKVQALRGAVESPAETPKATVKKTPAPSARDDVRSTFDALLNSGGLLDSARFQERAGITRQALSKAVSARRMFYVEVGGIRAYPAFYLDASLERAKVEAVTKLLGDLSGGSKWLFFTTAKGSLAKPSTGTPRTPLQALMDGDFDRVKQTAIGHAER
jgi:hypothetical protein